MARAGSGTSTQGLAAASTRHQQQDINNREAGMVSAEQVVEYLDRVDFPAHRDDLVRAAEQAGAPEEVIKALRGMPPEEYASKDEVIRSAHTPAEPDQDPSVKAAQARDKKHQRIAEPLREATPSEVRE
jgi:hypothetical protein